MENACVIGYGVVGKATAAAFGIKNHFDVDASKSNMLLEYAANFQYVFLCLPTPTKVGKQEIEPIADTIAFIEKNRRVSTLPQLDIEPIYILRSTVLPGTADSIMNVLNIDRVVSNPEFLDEATAMEDAANPNLIVIGARNDKYREAVKSVYQGRFKSRINTFITDNKTAELVKYAMNGFFATKVVYANIIYDIAQEWGANYETIKNALYSSPNVAKNHMTIWYKGGRGVRGRCLPKDLEAFATWTDSPFLNEVLKTAKLVTKEESNGSL